MSVIIPAHNEAALLPGCIRSVRRSAQHAGAMHETIVVSDASHDATVAVATDLECRVYEVDFRSRAKTRNFGARHANGAVLLFLDADSEISTTLVGASLALLAARWSVLWYAQRPLERHFAANLFFTLANLVGKIRPHFSPAILMTRDYFDASGGFDETYRSLEDYEVLARAWKRGVARQSSAIVATSTRRLTRFGAARGLRDFVAAVRDPRAVDWKPIND